MSSAGPVSYAPEGRFSALDWAVRVSLANGGHESPKTTVQRAAIFNSFLEGRENELNLTVVGDEDQLAKTVVSAIKNARTKGQIN